MNFRTLIYVLLLSIFLFGESGKPVTPYKILNVKKNILDISKYDKGFVVAIEEGKIRFMDYKSLRVTKEALMPDIKYMSNNNQPIKLRPKIHSIEAIDFNNLYILSENGELKKQVYVYKSGKIESIDFDGKIPTKINLIGRRLVVGFTDGSVGVYDDGNELFTKKEGSSAIVDIDSSEESGTIIYIDAKGVIYVLDAKSQEIKNKIITNTKDILNISLVGEKILAANSSNKRCVVYSTSNGDYYFKLSNGFLYLVNYFIKAPHAIYTNNENGDLLVFNTATAKEEFVFKSAGEALEKIIYTDRFMIGYDNTQNLIKWKLPKEILKSIDMEKN